VRGEEIAADWQIVVGDVVVEAGRQDRGDGVLIEGESSVDESMITGEPAGQEEAGDPVIGATIKKTGSFRSARRESARTPRWRRS
jgi:Cu+-exporting ATPase